MIIKLKNMHTILVFIGISGSGKSTKAKQINELAKSKGLKSVILSSDDCRHELLLDDSYHHHDIEMGHVSDKAFELMMYKVELYLKWPHNANLVILDAMHLYKEDRQKIIDLASKYCYDIIAVVLDYKNIEEYFVELDEKYSKKLISKQLRKFHTETLPELGKRLYDDLFRIKSKAEDIELEYNFDINVDGVNLSDDKHDFIVGDIHECLESFKDLLKKVGFKIEKDNGKEKIVGREDTRLIIDGDFIDKGNKTRETIEFLYDNIDRCIFVKGGHESFVYKYLKGQITQKNIDTKFYMSIPILEKDEELKQKFFAICDRMKAFLVGRHFTVTHAGCEYKFIGKTQKSAIRAQRYYQVDRFDSNVDDGIWLSNRRERLKYLKEESQMCHPLHIFGHESWKNNLIYKNRISIDTGCYMGGRLTGIEIDKWTGKYKLWHVDCSDEILVKEKLREFRFEEPRIEISELDDKDYNRLLRLARNKVNFISGTMCPADKYGGALENIDKALDYFNSNGIDKVMLQIKYMGSRCNIYLLDDIEKSYAISRNGFLIKLDLTNIYKQLKERLSDYFKANDLEMMIIDGELMPWSAMGENLIDSTFQAVNKGIRSELDLLKNNGFEEQFSKLRQQYQDSGFEHNRNIMNRGDLYKKYGAQKYEAYKLLSNFYMPDIDELEKLHGLYDEQLEIYAKSLSPEELISELHYQPFSILKSVKKNGEEIYYFNSDNETLFKMVNDSEYEICDLNSQEGYNKARLFFNKVTKESCLEGVVIKPLKVDHDHCAPYMKVRSPNYLTIIYGYDYLNNVKYERLMDQKRIRTKLKKSISEWKLGKKLLEVPYKDISENNPIYMDLMSKMIIEANEEKHIDPRL
jgi:predicted kinase